MRTASWFRAFRHSIALARRSRRRRVAAVSPLQRLEGRWVPSAATIPTVAMLSAATADSRSVTIDYRVNATSQDTAPLQFSVYRSGNPSPDPGDRLVGTWTGQPGGAGPLDDGGLPATSPGVHQLTISLPGGLPIDPRRPYVVVTAGAGDDLSAASFRKYTVGVVTHGALVNPSWKHGPPWQLQMARLLQQQGYDAVIPFNWAGQSSRPGRAPRQGARLAHQVLLAASQFPAGAPVDLQFIGHSEGTVVNTQAIATLGRWTTPELSAGYVVDTLLDPHAASNGVPGQMSVSGGLLGSLASAAISNYQSRADDPPVYIPAGVDEAQVFYQHSPASRYGQIYNLWGQVPVPNLSGHPIAYYNLTGAGVVHSGKHGIAMWYRNFVATTLGDQAPLIHALQLEGSVAGSTAPEPAALSALANRRIQAWGPVRSLATSRATFEGTAAPGSRVRVYVGPAADLNAIGIGGQVTADASGEWSLTTRSLPAGQYRAVAMSYAPALRTRPGLTIVPMAPLGRFTIEGGSRS